MNLGECAALVPEINERARRLRALSDGELRRLARGLRDAVVADGFAVAVEAARRAGGEQPAADRLAATVALHFGLRAGGDVVLAAVVNAVGGCVVHVISGTDEQARRDADRARPIGRLLGLDVGLVEPDLDNSGRKAVYQADITCGRAEQFGYDYLADNLSWKLDQLVQRELDCAFVAGVPNNLVEYLITAPVEGEKTTLARITAYGFFRRYRTLAGVGEPSGHPMSFEFEDVWDAQCRDFYERRRRVLRGDDLLDFRGAARDRSYERRCREVAAQTGLGPESIPVLQRTILLSCYDSFWREQLAGLGRLRERSLSHDDPVAEFRRLAAGQYEVMWELINREAVERFFDIDLAAQ